MYELKYRVLAKATILVNCYSFMYELKYCVLAKATILGSLALYLVNGCLQSLDWTSGLDWWAGLVD